MFFITGASPNEVFFQRYYPFDEFLYRDVENIVNTKPGMVFFSTAYYGSSHLAEHAYTDSSENPNIPNTITILQDMAKIGKGQFF